MAAGQRQNKVKIVMDSSLIIAPSLLAADFSRLGEEIKALEEASANWIHWDVMDGHFVQNLTLGPGIVKALRPLTSLFFDVHLMISHVDAFIEVFAQAGADLITIHPEAGFHPYQTLQRIKSLGLKAGVALNPGTSVQLIEPLLDLVDLVLVMTVNPGFGGQGFIKSQLDKIRLVKRKIYEKKRPIYLEVDGGITSQTARDAVAEGADVLVAGTFIFTHASYGEAIKMLKAADQS